MEWNPTFKVSRNGISIVSYVFRSITIRNPLFRIDLWNINAIKYGRFSMYFITGSPQTCRSSNEICFKMSSSLQTTNPLLLLNTILFSKRIGNSKFTASSAAFFSKNTFFVILSSRRIRYFPAILKSEKCKHI